MQGPDSAVSSGRKAAGARARRARTMNLPAELGIDSVAALKEQLGKLIAEPSKVVLDGAEVSRVHTAALQLFCLFCRDRRAEGREVEFGRPSPALLSAAALLGASTLLQLAQVKP
jgi:ABC-type transporter Mla MlaB component